MVEVEKYRVASYLRRYPGGKKKGTARPNRPLPGANRKKKKAPRRSSRLKK